MTKLDDGIKRRARQIQRSPRAVRNGWKYTACLRIAQREFAIEEEWRENFRRMNYTEEQIRLGIQKYRQENRERYEMPKERRDKPTDDPEGTSTRSKTEWAQRETKVVADLLGLPPEKNTNPEGVPTGDEGHGKQS